MKWTSRSATVHIKQHWCSAYISPKSHIGSNGLKNKNSYSIWIINEWFSYLLHFWSMSPKSTPRETWLSISVTCQPDLSTVRISTLEMSYVFTNLVKMFQESNLYNLFLCYFRTKVHALLCNAFSTHSWDFWYSKGMSSATYHNSRLTFSGCYLLMNQPNQHKVRQWREGTVSSAHCNCGSLEQAEPENIPV